VFISYFVEVIILFMRCNTFLCSMVAEEKIDFMIWGMSQIKNASQQEFFIFIFYIWWPTQTTWFTIWYASININNYWNIKIVLSMLYQNLHKLRVTFCIVVWLAFGMRKWYYIRYGFSYLSHQETSLLYFVFNQSSFYINRNRF